MMKTELSDERTEYIDYIEMSTLMGLGGDLKVQGWVFEEEVNEENNRYLKYWVLSDPDLTGILH